jgi:hypothetical protein
MHVRFWNLGAERCRRDARDEIANRANHIVNAFVERVDFFFSNCAFRLDLPAVFLGDLQQLIDFIFLQDLCG